MRRDRRCLKEGVRRAGGIWKEDRVCFVVLGVCVCLFEDMSEIEDVRRELVEVKAKLAEEKRRVEAEEEMHEKLKKQYANLVREKEK